MIEISASAHTATVTATATATATATVTATVTDTVTVTDTDTVTRHCHRHSHRHQKSGGALHDAIGELHSIAFEAFDQSILVNPALERSLPTRGTSMGRPRTIRLSNTCASKSNDYSSYYTDSASAEVRIT